MHEEIGSQSFISMSLAQLERHSSAKILKVAYDTAFGHQEIMKKFQTACISSIDTKQKYQWRLHKEFDFSYKAGQLRRCDL